MTMVPNVSKKLRTPVNQKEKLWLTINVYLADSVSAKLSSRALQILACVKYLQRKGEEVYPGEVHAMYYEITKDRDWQYTSAVEACNRLFKKGYLEKHKLGRCVAYTLSEKAKVLFD